MRLPWAIPIVLSIALTVLAGAVFGTDRARAEPPRTLQPTQLLRQATLDLWGEIPTADALQAAAIDLDPEATADALLADPRFSRFVRRHHADLLWPTVDPNRLVTLVAGLLLPAYAYDTGPGATTDDRLFTLLTGLISRGAFVPCKDEPAEFDASGRPITEAWPDGSNREGWVMVAPYWSPETPVKVCAFEALTALVSPINGADCGHIYGQYGGECGCGPNLEHCVTTDAAETIRQALIEQTMRSVERATLDGGNYFDMLTDRSVEVNGALAHYFKHLAPMGFDPYIQHPPVPAALLPDLAFNDPDWRSIQGGHEQSGLLTSMLYLLRFQTARSRANQFYGAFLCQPFVAGDIALPSPDAPCSQEPDLRKRCGCNGCHITLEPAAAHWARFAEAGTAWLAPELYPAHSDACATCATNGTCDPICERFYLTEAGHPDETPYIGMLRGFIFRDDDELGRMQSGPAGLVAEKLATGALPRCTTRRVFERLFGRSATPDEAAVLLPQFTAEFTAKGYDFRTLVRAMITHPAYGRAQR